MLIIDEHRQAICLSVEQIVAYIVSAILAVAVQYHFGDSFAGTSDLREAGDKKG